MGLSAKPLALRSWLDDDGKLTYGKKRGQYVQDVAITEPSYLLWVLENVELKYDDYEIIEYWYRRYA